MDREQLARQNIDAMLTASGWAVQSKASINLVAQRGVDIEELSFKSGEPDYTFFVGVILFSEGGDRDKLGRGRGSSGWLPERIHQNHVSRARLNVADLNPKLVSWDVNTFGQKFFFDASQYTTNRASISMSKLKSLPDPILPPSEQVHIWAEGARRLSVVEELEALVTTNLQCATRLRQSVLQCALSGSI